MKTGSDGSNSTNLFDGDLLEVAGKWTAAQKRETADRLERWVKQLRELADAVDDATTSKIDKAAEMGGIGEMLLSMTPQRSLPLN